MAIAPFLLVAVAAAVITVVLLSRWRRANPDVPWPTATLAVLAIVFVGYLGWLAWMTFGVGPSLRDLEPGAPPLLWAWTLLG